MEHENQLSEKESLQLISRMIHEAKGYFYESGNNTKQPTSNTTNDKRFETHNNSR